MLLANGLTGVRDMGGRLAEIDEWRTKIAAGLLNNATDFGAVESGKRADLLLLDANPFDDIRNTQRISAVVLDGKLLARNALVALLREAEQTANRN